MVNLNIALLGKRPGLIYGVKRAKVPTKLRPNLLPQKQTTGQSACTEEMFRLLACWKRNAYEDSKCSEEIQSFMKCAERQKLDAIKSKKTWSRDEVNSTLKHYTQHLKRARSY